jgi:formylglycine-generating enzyme
MVRPGWASRAVSAAVCAALVVALMPSAQAGSSQEPPEICKMQVSRAVGLLSSALQGRARARRVAAGAQGSLESAVRGYVSTTVHALDEGTVPSPSSGVCPSDMAKVLGAFCVDKYEASLLERKDDGALVPADPYVTPSANHVYIARSVAQTVPQGYVSAAQADAACKQAKKRLCQPVEWRLACAGGEGTAFPYGPTRVAGKCHDSGKNPMMTLHSDTMSRGWGTVEMNDPRANAMEGGLAKTGAFPECVNDYGLYDMVGNLHEWTADPNGTFQGGFWLDTAHHGDGCAYRTIAHDFGYHDYSTGFRCCADPRPQDP